MKQNKNRNYLQWQIFERDSYTCVLCNRAACELHHVVRKSQGGSDLPGNLVSVCRFCHLGLHGQRIAGEERTGAEMRQTVLEYVSDYYAYIDGES